MGTNFPLTDAIQLGKRSTWVRFLPKAEDAPSERTIPKLPKGVVRPADRDIEPINVEGVKEEEYQYELHETNEDISLSVDGLNRAYGIFGTTGSGKTTLMLHMLQQLLKLRFKEDPRDPGRQQLLLDPGGDLAFGGLILDPKGALYKDVDRLFREAGRRADLIVIGDHQEEGKEYNIIDATLDPQDLGAALSMAAQSAGIKSMEESWMNELRGIFAATLHVLEVAYSRKPTLNEMAAALLDDEEFPDDVARKKPASEFFQGKKDDRRGPMFLYVLTERLPPKEAKLKKDEKRDLEISKGRLLRLLEHDQRNYSILRTFIDESYGEFRYAKCQKFSVARRTDPSAWNIYEDVIQSGKTILVNVSRENLAVSRQLCTVVKCLFQQMVLTRKAPRLTQRLTNNKRPLFFIADEYSGMATELKESPMGDSKFFSQMREFQCLGIVATQSVNMMLQPLSKEDWEAIYANLAAKIFMKLGDPETAEAAKKLASQSDFRIETWGKNMDGSKTVWQEHYDLREKVDFPVKLLTQGFKTGEAVAIGDLTGGKKPPRIDFLKVPYP